MLNWMKKWKIGLWLLSLAAAIILWLYTTAYINPEETILREGVKLEFAGEDVLLQRNLVLMNNKEDTVGVRIRGKRMDLIKLTGDQITARIDVSDITGAISQNHAYTVAVPENIQLMEQVPRSIAVRADNLMTEAFEVNLTVQPEVAQGFIGEKPVLEPATVKISGPESLVKEISHASVVLRRNEIDSTVTETLPFTLISKDGAELPSNLLTPDVEQIKVTIPVSMLKDIPLSVDIAPGGGATEKNIEYSIDPPSIKVSGDPAILSGYNHLAVGTLDLARIIASEDLTFPILLPNDTTNISGQREAKVSVQIKGLVTKSLDTSNIEIINAPDGRAAVLLTESLAVQIRGPEEAVKQVSSYNVRAVADLAGLNLPTGQHTVDVNVYVDGFPDVGAIGSGYKTAIDVGPPGSAPPPAAGAAGG